MKIKLRRNYMKRDWSPATINNQPSMTQPEHESDLEINSVMARYVATGYLPPAKAGPIFADLSDSLNFDGAQDKILRANALFLDLPTDVRDEFRTADELLKAFQSDRGRAKLKSFGFFKEEPVAQTPVAESEVQPQKQGGKADPAS